MCRKYWAKSTSPRHHSLKYFASGTPIEMVCLLQTKQLLAVATLDESLTAGPCTCLLHTHMSTAHLQAPYPLMSSNTSCKIASAFHCRLQPCGVCTTSMLLPIATATTSVLIAFAGLRHALQV